MTLLKIAPYIALALASLTGGFFAGSKNATRIAQETQVPCGACNCPPAAQVDLGNLDFGKINNRKGTLEITVDQKFDHITVVVDSATFAKIMQGVKK